MVYKLIKVTAWVLDAREFPSSVIVTPPLETPKVGATLVTSGLTPSGGGGGITRSLYSEALGKEAALEAVPTARDSESVSFRRKEVSLRAGRTQVRAAGPRTVTREHGREEGEDPAEVNVTRVTLLRNPEPVTVTLAPAIQQYRENRSKKNYKKKNHDIFILIHVTLKSLVPNRSSTMKGSTAVTSGGM